MLLYYHLSIVLLAHNTELADHSVCNDLLYISHRVQDIRITYLLAITNFYKQYTTLMILSIMGQIINC